MIRADTLAAPAPAPWHLNLLLAGLDEALAAQLGPYLRLENYTAGADILREGEASDRLCLLAAGSVGIYSGSTAERLATVGAGNYFGEMGIFSGKARSATVRAEEPVELWSVTAERLLQFQAASGFDLLAHSHQAHLAVLSQRLDHTNQVAAASMRERMEEYRLRVAFGSLATNIILLLFFYISALGLLRQLATGDTSTPTSSAIIVAVAAAAGWMAHRSGLPWATFGLSWHRWRWVLADALRWSLGLCALMTLVKLVLVLGVPRYAHLRVFEPWVSVKGLGYTFGMYAVYALLAPLQEFMTRGVLQGSLERMLTGRGATAWAVFASAAVFSIMHQHLGLDFALTMLPVGLIWGWMYHRHQSLLGVAISHILIGIWMTGVINLPSLTR